MGGSRVSVTGGHSRAVLREFPAIPKREQVPLEYRQLQGSGAKWVEKHSSGIILEGPPPLPMATEELQSRFHDTHPYPVTGFM